MRNDLTNRFRSLNICKMPEYCTAVYNIMEEGFSVTTAAIILSRVDHKMFTSQDNLLRIFLRNNPDFKAIFLFHPITVNLRLKIYCMFILERYCHKR